MNNKQRWDAMKISEAQGPIFKKVSDVLSAPSNKARYVAVSNILKAQKYNIPWEFIAVAHYREAGFDKTGNPRFDRYLGNGQALNKKTTIVPKNRGPFTGEDAWEKGAVDALVYAPPYAAKNKDWSIEGTLNKLEEYNGLGYRQMGKPSPYLWARTNQYVKGKYVADRVYDPNHVDKQLGVAGILKFLGYGKPTGGAVIAAGAGTVAVATTAYTLWDHIMHHWIAYGLGTAAVVGLVWLMAYAYAHRDDNNV